MLVYHMKGYGAIEMGIHPSSPGHEDTKASAKAASFILQYKDGAWKIGPRS